MPPLASSLEKLFAHENWFEDPEREIGTGAVPPILVLDDFYEDPDEIRRAALARPYVQYIPPDPDIVGVETAEKDARRQGRWLSTAFVTYHGKPAVNPFHGERFNPPWLREKLEKCVGEPIALESWETGGDHWNGAFHLVERGFGVGEGVIHHHFKKGDLEGRGWSGVVYLSPDAPTSSGTSFWRDRSTGRCVASFAAPFRFDPDGFECVLKVENRFNRAVLLRENVWHRVEHGFGEGAGARLTQTFFFAVE